MKCLDTSALIELAVETPDASSLLTGSFILADTTLAEFCYVILKRYNEKTGNYWFSKLQPHAYPVSLELLYEAAKFRWEQKHSKMSLFDAIAYTFARKQGCTLVTTDNDFRHLPGVEFIRKKPRFRNP